MIARIAAMSVVVALVFIGWVRYTGLRGMCSPIGDIRVDNEGRVYVCEDVQR